MHWLGEGCASPVRAGRQQNNVTRIKRDPLAVYGINEPPLKDHSHIVKCDIHTIHSRGSCKLDIAKMGYFNYIIQVIIPRKY